MGVLHSTGGKDHGDHGEAGEGGQPPGVDR